VRGSLALIAFLLLTPQVPESVRAREVVSDRAAAAVSERAAAAESDRAAAHAVLHDVLSQRAFASMNREAWSTGFRRRLEERLTDIWARLIGSRFSRPSTARAVAWAISSAAVAVLIAWLLRVARRSRRNETFELEAPVRDERGWQALAQHALDLIRGGQTREGARLAYRAAVQRLEDDGLFTRDAARTPREYLRLIPEQHRRRPALSILTGAFERIWYGSQEASTDEGRTIVMLLQELECLPREQAN